MKTFFAAATAATLFCATSAHAATVYNLEASGASAFTISFEDLDSDMWVDLNEILGFSGLTAGGEEFNEVVSLPETQSPNGENFVFGQTRGATEAIVSEDQLELTVSIAAVPLPASALLLLAGVAGLAGMKRRKTA